MDRRDQTKKQTEKRAHLPLETTRPAGIQSMDYRLYVEIQRVIRALDCRPA